MSYIIAKNTFPELNCFFTRDNLENISRPRISYLKIDSASRSQLIFHNGFSENMGSLKSFKINAGVMIFEVLEGYPLQDLLFKNNKINTSYKFRLEDLGPLDFYCVQKNDMDIYGDFVLKNLKFTSSRMEQSVENYGRRIIAEFQCSEAIPFRMPYFHNKFISDDYEYHIIRDKKEIYQICEDIESFSENISKKLFLECFAELDGKFYNYDNVSFNQYAFILTEEVKRNFKLLVLDMITKKTMNENSPVLRLQRFIKIFYTYKNKFNERKIRKSQNLKLTNMKRLAGGE